MRVLAKKSRPSHKSPRRIKSVGAALPKRGESKKHRERVRACRVPVESEPKYSYTHSEKSCAHKRELPIGKVNPTAACILCIIALLYVQHRNPGSSRSSSSSWLSPMLQHAARPAQVFNPARTCAAPAAHLKRTREREKKGAELQTAMTARDKSASIIYMYLYPRFDPRPVMVVGWSRAAVGLDGF